MSLIKQHQQFVLNDIANEQEQLMQEVMADEVSGDADYHEAHGGQAVQEKYDKPTDDVPF